MVSIWEMHEIKRRSIIETFAAIRNRLDLISEQILWYHSNCSDNWHHRTIGADIWAMKMWLNGEKGCESKWWPVIAIIAIIAFTAIRDMIAVTPTLVSHLYSLYSIKISINFDYIFIITWLMKAWIKRIKHRAMANANHESCDGCDQCFVALALIQTMRTTL